MRKMFSAAVAALPLTAAAPAAAEVTLQINANGTVVYNGNTYNNVPILNGATGVVVGDSIYDVRFVDGTCGSLFTNCGASGGAAFAFTDSTSASAAAQALFDQVFSLTANGQPIYYDWNPFLAGCGNFALCQSLIPYLNTNGSVFADSAVNYSQGYGDSNDRVNLGVNLGSPSNTDTSIYDSVTYAVFTRTGAVTAAVPEPATWAMMLLGFGAIAFQTRRKRHLNSTYLAQVA